VRIPTKLNPFIFSSL